MTYCTRALNHVDVRVHIYMCEYMYTRECTSIYMCVYAQFMPTYRLPPGCDELVSVLAGELAELQDALSVLVAGVGRVSEVLRPLHHRLQLVKQSLLGQ